MKYFALILLIILSTFIGFLLTLKTEKRKNFFCDFYSFNNALINVVSFNKKTIKEILNSSDKKSIFYSNLIDNYFYGKNISIDFLCKEELIFYLEYIQFLRRTNIEIEIKFLLDCKEKLEKKSEFYIEKLKKDRVLYVKLGFFLGLLLFVLLI